MVESARSAKILIVDDETGIRRALRGYLQDEGYDVADIDDGSKLLDAIDSDTPDLIVMDVVMPGRDGLATLEALRERRSDVPVVMMSGQASVERAVQATRLGAYDFLEKPLTPEKLLVTVGRALEWRRLRSDNEVMRSADRDTYRMVGDSAASREVLAHIERVAPTGAKVLILGENGTGKELVARAIHALSDRTERPFVKVNCAAIPRDLVESELFGHEKGAFTGATDTRRGKFELADQGTLFLDEIGDMSLEAQAKLLRALETGEAERVGGSQTIRFDVRTIAATNKNLTEDIEAGRFRQDLYFRLAVVPIQLKPLRERRDDVAPLVTHFLTTYCSENGRPPIEPGTDAIDALARYEWPGNIRELRNLMERIAIMHPEPALTAEDVETYVPDARPGASGPEGDADGTLKSRLDQHEHQILLAELDRSGWNVSAAAKVLGIDRASLHRKMRRHGIVRES